MSFTSENLSRPEFSVILCAYSVDRWDDLCAAVESLRKQSLRPREIILVVDHNRPLYEKARASLPGVIVLENRETPGLSGARNTGLAAARGELVAFMDEDASAEPDWLERLARGYENPDVLGVGGSIEPVWEGGRPDWFPEEFDWVVGCTYRGMPEVAAPVRNLIGANMSFRREVFTRVSGFRNEMGRNLKLPAGCEETELCIRVRQMRPESVLLYLPEARVRHRVPEKRASWRYFFTRCFAEGLSKARVSYHVGARDGLASERIYSTRTLPVGIWRGLTEGIRRREKGGFLRAFAILAGFSVTAAGYLAGRVSSFRHHPSGTPIDTSAEHDRQDEGRVDQRGAMRILLVTPRYPPLMGGVENHVYQVARRLARMGADVTVLTTDLEGDLPPEEVSEGVKIRRVKAWPKRRDYYFAPEIYPIVSQGDWDIVHVQSYHTLVAPLAMLAAWRAGIPYVLTFHGGGHSSRLRNALRLPQRLFLRPLLARAERLVATARFEIGLFGKQLRLPEEKFIYIPNGSDISRASRNGHHKREWALIASVGRLERYKGHQRILSAFPLILSRRPEARLWIAGSGPYEPHLQRMAERLGVAERVEIRAIPQEDRDRMAEELSKAALVTLLSEYETHPMSALEALALGCPLLVAGNSGLQELAERGWAASIPTNSPPAQVAEAVLNQLNRSNAPEGLDLPTWDACAEGLFELYRQYARSKPCAS